MDLEFLDKSSRITPLLVDLYKKQGLNSFARDNEFLDGTDILNAIGELFSIEVTLRESEMIADVMIEMFRQAELDIREAVSQRLSLMDNVPLRLVLQISNDEIAVARHVLMRSTVLEDLDIIYIIKSHGPEYWQVIAKRKVMSDQIALTLAKTGDFDTAVALVENTAIDLSERAVLVLSDLAQNSEMLAAPLLRRDEISNEVAGKLYQFVGEKIKQEVLHNFKIDSNTLIDAVDDVVQELIASNERSEFTPDGAMLATARDKKEKGILNVTLMLETLRRGQISSFVAEFSTFAGISYRTVEEVLGQPSGQGLAVACRAFDVEKTDFVSMYLLTNRVRNKGYMVDVQEMARAISYFNRIKPDVAKNIMENSISDDFRKA